MKLIKRIITVLLATALLIPATGCKKNAGLEQSSYEIITEVVDVVSKKNTKHE
jgi:hypothetical protein